MATRKRPAAATPPAPAAPTPARPAARKTARKTVGAGARHTAPLRRTCACMAVHHGLLEQHPAFRLAQSRLEHAFMDARRLARVVPAQPYRIQVVVHVLESPGAGSVTAGQIAAQMKALNDDFRARNTDRSKVPPVWKGLVADAMVEFQLATTDPAGRPTTGVLRVPTAETQFGTDDGMKDPARGGSAAWPTRRYLNIWVCALRGGLLGYAQFPGGPADTDGVVIGLNAFGTGGTAQAPFDKGRTCTHEVGHYLNLRHIWGDTPDCSGGDSVADTPNAEGPNYGTPSFPSISCQNGPNGDMFMNYMDYVDDEAMYMFSPEQVVRMQATLDGPRKALWS